MDPLVQNEQPRRREHRHDVGETVGYEQIDPASPDVEQKDGGKTGIKSDHAKVEAKSAGKTASSTPALGS